MIDPSKIKVTTKETDYHNFEHVGNLVVTGAALHSMPEYQEEARKEAKRRVWDEMYGDLDELVREVAIAGHNASSLLGPMHMECIDQLRNAVQRLHHKIQYPHENTTANSTQSR